jgi:transposase
VIQLTPHMRILLAVAPVDFRNGTDGLARLCHQVLRSDPQEGAVFCFRNRRATSVRLLTYDGQGFWLCQKRLSAGRFQWWPKEGQQEAIQLDVQELQLLLWNGNPAQAQTAPAWRPIATKGSGSSPVGEQAGSGSVEKSG